MEHIIQFGIGIDDDKIIKSVEEKAEKEIIKSLNQKVTDNLFNSPYYGYHDDPKYGFSTWMENKVDKFFSDHKEEIVNQASKYLAEKLSRTKACKELLSKM